MHSGFNKSLFLDKFPFCQFQNSFAFWNIHFSPRIDIFTSVRPSITNLSVLFLDCFWYTIVITDPYIILVIKVYLIGRIIKNIYGFIPVSVNRKFSPSYLFKPSAVAIQMKPSLSSLISLTILEDKPFFHWYYERIYGEKAEYKPTDYSTRWSLSNYLNALFQALCCSPNWYPTWSHFWQIYFIYMILKKYWV